MTQEERSKFLLSLGEANLEAPETPHYLEVAARLLEARRRELQEAQSPAPAAEEPGTTPSSPIASSPAPSTPSVFPRFPAAPAFQATPATPAFQAAPRPPLRRAHWFSDRFPRITLEDGSVQIPRSLEELKGVLRARGITPHPRGDASMLLWQIRNRLKMGVETVGSQDF